MHEIDPSWQMLYLSHAFQTEILLQDLRFRGCSPTLCVFRVLKTMHGI